MILNTELYFMCLGIFLAPTLCKEECSSQEKKHFSHAHTYSKEENEIFGEISKAKLSYVPCKYNNCSCYEVVMKEDLKPFIKGITLDMINSAQNRGVRYQLINHRLYRDKECMFPFRCSGIEHFISEVRQDLDDFEVVINTRDWPQISKFHAPTPLPVFSFSKTKDYYDIMYPAWSFWEGGPAIRLYPTGLGRWDQHRHSLNAAAAKWSWDRKKKKAFFRGSRTSKERDILIEISRKNPAYVDAAYTKNQAWKSVADTLGVEPVEELSLEDHCQFKYLFNFRGVAASFRLRHLFLCRSLVFHVGDEWLEFFYDGLKPWIHYVPVSSSAKEDDYNFLLDFFRRHEDVSEQIASEGTKFIMDHLKMQDITCYWKLLLQHYTMLLKFKPVLDNDLIDVTKE